MPGLYALFLLISIGGLGILDYRYKLAMSIKPRQALTILAISITIFIFWDIAGIAADIFRIGDNNLLIGLRVGDFPVEELLFLVLLNYNSLVVYTALQRRSRP